MALGVLIARVVLAAVFVVAGLAKLRDLPGSREAAAQFGVPARLAGAFGLLLPLAELGVGVALLPASSARWGALGALSLLLGFTAAIAAALARGRKPDCHCFGQVYSSPVSGSTLARNLVLAGLAGFALLAGWNDPGPSAVGWVADLSVAAMAALGGAIAFGLILATQIWFWLALLRQNGRLLVRLESIERRLGGTGASREAISDWRSGLPVGDPAPEFELPSVDGERVSLQALRARGRPVMLVFTDPKCGPCNALLPDLASWQATVDAATVALISTGERAAHAPMFAEHGLRDVALQDDREVADAYQAPGTPSAVLISPDGRIASPVGGGTKRIRKLVDYVRAAHLEILSVPGANGTSRPSATREPQSPTTG